MSKLTRDDWNLFILLALAMVLLTLAKAAGAQEVVDSGKKWDKPYWSAVAITGAGVGLDAWTTVSLIHPNRSHGCIREAGTPWLYGSKPTTGRTAIAMAGELAVSGVASYILRKHYRRPERLETRAMGILSLAPLGWEAGVHWRGAINNLEVCR